MKYNIWNAIAYEVTVMLINFDEQQDREHDPLIQLYGLVRVED